MSDSVLMTLDTPLQFGSCLAAVLATLKRKKTQSRIETNRASGKRLSLNEKRFGLQDCLADN
jgi:hypothetical protein